MAPTWPSRDFPQPSAKRHYDALSIAVSGAALGTRLNFIIGAERARHCSNCVHAVPRGVIARRIGGDTRLPRLVAARRSRETCLKTERLPGCYLLPDLLPEFPKTRPNETKRD